MRTEAASVRTEVASVRTEAASVRTAAEKAASARTWVGQPRRYEPVRKPLVWIIDIRIDHTDGLTAPLVFWSIFGFSVFGGEAMPAVVLFALGMNDQIEKEM